MGARLAPLLVALVVALLGAGAILLVERWQAQRSADVAPEVMALEEGVAQRIRDFQRMKVEDGRKVWEVSARVAEYFEDEGIVRVEEPILTFAVGENHVVDLRGASGQVLLDDFDVRGVELSGDLAVTLGAYRLEADTGQYERNNGLIVAPGHIRLVGDELEAEGTGLEVDVRARTLRIGDGVRMTLFPGR